jgi:hypothetical protein
LEEVGGREGTGEGETGVREQREGETGGREQRKGEKRGGREGAEWRTRLGVEWGEL